MKHALKGWDLPRLMHVTCQAQRLSVILALLLMRLCVDFCHACRLKKQLQEVAAKEAAAAAATEGGRRPKKGLGPGPLLTAVPVPTALANQKSLSPVFGITNLPTHKCAA